MGVRRLIWEDAREWKRIGYLGFDKAEKPIKLRDVLRLLWTHVGLRATVWYRLSNAAHRSIRAKHQSQARTLSLRYAAAHTERNQQRS